MNKPSKLISESNANPAETSTPVNDGPSGPTDDGPQTPLKLVSPQKEEELDEDEREFRAMRRDLAGAQGESAIGIVAISVGKTPEKNEYFRTHPDSSNMVETLASIGIAVSDHVLYLTVTSQRAVRIVPVRQASADGEQNDYDRTKEIGLVRARDEWVRLYTDQGNRCYKVSPAPLGRFADPIWPPLKPAKIFRLAFRDRGRLIGSAEHPQFLKWAARDSA